jgi:hypothetical protein
MDAERSFERLTREDLVKLRDLAREALAERILTTPVGRLYAGRLLLLALCQGAALHYLDGAHGVKDLDVWAFFRDGPPKPFPWRARWTADFGPSHLGRSPADAGFAGRRVDILGRSIAMPPGESPQGAVIAWLRGGTASAAHLRRRPMIGLFPDAFFLRSIWRPPGSAFPETPRDRR